MAEREAGYVVPEARHRGGPPDHHHNQQHSPPMSQAPHLHGTGEKPQHDAHGADAGTFDIERGTLQQDASMYDWKAFRPGCGCLNFVLQLVLVGSIGSFMFGINISLLNTSLSMINADFLTCGPDDPRYASFWGVSTAVCAADETCKAVCGIFDDANDPNLMTAVRCPGGYNDLDCDKLKWFNAVVQSSLLLAATFGSMIAGRFLSWGRRTCFLGILFLFVIGIISSTCSNSFSALVWARLIVGFAVGMTSVVSPSYMSEVTPKEKRGSYGVIHQLQVTVGIFVGTVLGLPLTNPSEQDDLWAPDTFQRFWWRFMVGLGLLPTCLGIYYLARVYTHDTPIWYCEQRRYRDAAELLKLIHNKSDVSFELKELIDSVKEAEHTRQNGLSFSAAFQDAEYRKVIVIGCLLSAFQQFGGINVFMTSSSELFKRAGLDGTMQTVMTIVMTVINVLMTFPTLYLIERLGRRTLLFGGCVGQLIFVLPAAILYWTESDPDFPSDKTKYMAIVGVFGFVIFFAVAYGPVLWVYLFEVYPVEIRDVAAGLATAINWLAGFIMVFVIIVLPSQVAYTVFAVLQLVATLIVFFFMKETKGLPLGESPYLSKNRAA